MDGDLEHSEQIVDKAKENAHWVSGACTPCAFLLAPDVDPLRLFQALPTLEQELEDIKLAMRRVSGKRRKPDTP